MLENAKECEMTLEERRQIVLDSDPVTWENTTVAGTGHTTGVDATVAGTDRTTVAGVGNTAGVDTEHETGKCLTEVEYLNGEIEKLENERNRLIMERADFARTEMHLRMLLELVDGMKAACLVSTSSAGNRSTCLGTQGVTASVNANGSAGTGASVDTDTAIDTGANGYANASGGVDNGDVERVYGDACSNYEEFFERTRYMIPKNEIYNGRIQVFDNDMVIRFLDRVIVKDDGYEVWFKGRIMVEG